MACGAWTDSSQQAPPDDSSPGWEALQDLTSFEREVLADKYVSAEELARAGDQLVECLENNDIRVAHIDDTNPGPSGVVSEFDADSAVEAEDSAAKESGCRANVSAVAEVWVLQNELTAGEQVRAMKEFIDCVRAAGITVAAGSTFDEVYHLALKRLHESLEIVSPASVELESCMANVDEALTISLPGLRDALERLDTEMVD